MVRAALAAIGLLAAIAFFVQPAFDDFATARPIFDLDPAMLLPALFWRPVEKLHLAVVGALPSLFPAYLHAVAVVGHLLAVAALWRLAPRGRWALAFFACSPAVVGPLWSVDGAIALWSGALGLWGLVLLERRPAGSSWLLLVLAAALHKETGLAWFVALPILHWAGSGDRGRLVRQLSVGAAGAAGYFALRALLPGAAFVAAEGRYGLVLEPELLLLGLAHFAAFALLPLDPIALVRGPDLLFGASLLAGLPLLLWTATRLARSSAGRRWLVALPAVAVALAAPVLPLGHVSEMYVYPLVGVASLALAAAGPGIGRWGMLSLGLFCLFGLAADLNKARPMIGAGSDARAVGRRVAEAWPEARPRPARVCLVRQATSSPSYSVFLGSPGRASGWGRAVDREWGFTVESFVAVARAADCPEAFEAVIECSADGSVHILPR